MMNLTMNGKNRQSGKIVLEEIFPGCVEVFYIPDNEDIEIHRSQGYKLNELRAKILLINRQDNFIEICPKITFPDKEDFLESKYGKLKSIVLKNFNFSFPSNEDDVLDILNSLPSGFIKNFHFGLGLQREYRFIIKAIKQISDCTEVVVIDEGASTGINQEYENTFNISWKDFEIARRNINKIAKRSQGEAVALKEVEVYNVFSKNINKKIREIRRAKNSKTEAMLHISNGDAILDDSIREAVFNSIDKNKKQLAQKKPKSLAKLYNDIELVTLEVLIERFSEMLKSKHKEDKWQDFFNENPFILSMAFGYPIVKIKGQASIGGRKIAGDGEKIADFLVKNRFTNNTALFEIKTPQTKILSNSLYRAGVYTPSSDLSGSINQVLDQKYQFQKHIAQIKESSRIYDIESYAVHGCLIIGKTPIDVDKQKSFELFRRNSKDVQIFTFDELYEKLKELHAFLSRK